MLSSEETTLASLDVTRSISRSSLDMRELETPRNSSGDISSPVIPIRGAWGCPESPTSVRKTKSRAGRGMNRYDSLREAKLLMVTDLRRSDSMLANDLFSYNSNFERLGLIGQTRTSEVFKVRNRHSGEIFAVKRSRRRFRSKLQRERCLREIRAVAALPPHQNIVGQYRAWQEGGHFYLQMDFCSGGSLQRLIQESGCLSNEQLWKVAADVATGLDFLHTNNILHLDIKPENIYRDASEDGKTFGPWRIGDFGLAVAKETQDWEEGDGDYVSPELLKAGGELTPFADIFSLGATLYECATGKKLPRREGSADAADVNLPGHSTEFVDMINSMLQSDPLARPSAGQVSTYACTMQMDNKASGPESLTNGIGIAIDNALGTEQGSRIVETKTHSMVQHEGSSTPSAAASLMGLTPMEEEQKRSKNLSEVVANAGRKKKMHGSPKNSKGMKNRPPPIQIPPSFSQLPPLSSTARTNETNGSFHIRQRGMFSPDSDALISADDSEAVSFSCDTTGSGVSDLEFPDVFSPGSARPLPSTSSAGVSGFRRLSSFSMGKDMHASPEWGANSPTKTRRRRSRSAGNSPEATSKLTPVCQNVRSRMGGPTLHVSNSTANANRSRLLASDGNEIDIDDNRRPGSWIRRIQAPSFYSKISPFEEQEADKDDKTKNNLDISEMKQSSVIIPPLILPTDSSQGIRRKRQHSSRRALVNVLRESNNNANNNDLPTSRSIEVCSSRTELCSSRSIEQLMPAKKGARHGGAFSVHTKDSDKWRECAGEIENIDAGSAPSTGRSLLGKPNTARSTETLGDKHPKEFGDMCCATTAAMRMTIMTLDDDVPK